MSETGTQASSRFSAGWPVFFWLIILGCNFAAASFIQQPHFGTVTSIAFALLVSQFGAIAVLIPLIDKSLLVRTTGGGIIGLALTAPFIIGLAKHVSSRDTFDLLLFLPLAQFAAQLPFWWARIAGWRITREKSAAPTTYTISDLLITTLVFAALAVCMRASWAYVNGNLGVLVPITIFSLCIYAPVAWYTFVLEPETYVGRRILGIIGISILVGFGTSMVFGAPLIAFFATLGVAMFALLKISCNGGYKLTRGSSGN